ncbi:MAG: tetratricopeptide repeat protein [Anaerolineales bacterium]
MVQDPLTGVYSRITLEQRLKEEIVRAIRYDTPVSIILLDLDHFKSINDGFGHRRGDQILIEFTERLCNLSRRSDILFRYGGDEFLFLLPNTSKPQADLLAHRLLDEIASRPFGGSPPVVLSISLGVAEAPRDATTAEVLFEKADHRHYIAKRLGRARVISEDPQRDEDLLPFDEDTRLLERDEALSSFHDFITSLPDHRRGVFIVSGPPGSGKTRFLAEAGKLARLQGYEVLALHGSPALKNRVYGDLSEAILQWSILPPPAAGVEVFSEGLQHLIEEKGRSGLFFLVDQFAEVDWATRDMLLQYLLSGSPPITLGLVYSSGSGNAQRLFPSGTSLRETVTLNPLTPQAIRIWLRSMLGLEAPEEFTNWLHEQTGGLPGNVRNALYYLLERNVLMHPNDKWEIATEYTKESLKEKLGFQSIQPPNNLPSLPTGLVGRENEILEAKRMLGSSRLLTIIGPGGVGKTRLALQVAAELHDEFPSGVFWIPFATVMSAEMILASMAVALGFTFYGGEDPEVQFFNFLYEKQLLMLLDNLEHLSEGVDVLARLLERAPKVKLLCTSRERLNLQGEAVSLLGGMQIPENASLDHLEGFSAIQLFLQAARLAKPEFAINEDNKASVVQICKLVDGLPLGIEMAASWVRMLSPEQIAQEMIKNLNFLSSNQLDRPLRHQSLRAIFEQSWFLLTPQEKPALARLAIFPSHFNREAASAVGQANLLTLSNLLDKSMLQAAQDGRYAIHEVIRRFSLEKLESDDSEWEMAHQKYVDYYAGVMLEASKNLYGRQQIETLNLINQEIENVLHAWNWCIDHALWHQIDQMLQSLFLFYEIRGLVQEGDKVLLQAQVLLESLDETEFGEAEPIQLLLGRILVRRGVFVRRLALYEISQGFTESGLEILRHQSDASEQAFALLKLGQLFEEIGNYEAGRSACREGLLLYQNLNDQHGTAQVLNQLGVIAYQCGRYAEAEKYTMDSLDIFRKLEDTWNLAMVLVNLGNVESELGVYHRAQRYYREALEFFQQVGDVSGKAAALNNLGDIARELAEFDQAQAYLQQSLNLYQQLGNRYGQSVAMCNLGEVLNRQNETTKAHQILQQSLAICDETGNRTGMAYALVNLATIMTRQGDYETARQFLCRAISLAHENEALPLVMDVLIAYGQWLRLNDKGIQALQVLMYASRHPATMKARKKEAERLISRLASELPPAETRQAYEISVMQSMDEILQIVKDECQTSFSQEM